MKNKFFFIVLLFFSDALFAQVSNPLLQKRFEYWMERNQTENVDLTQIQEIWEYHLENPLNLNTIQKEDLASLDLLSDIQINDLMEHRTKYGPLLSLFELQTLATWDTSFIQLILPFVTLDERTDNSPLTLYELTQKGKIEAITRFQHPVENTFSPTISNSNNSSTSYEGNGDYYLTRIRYTYQQRVSFGITAEKDVGEPFFNKINKNGFDFYSSHLQVKAGKRLKNLLFGDYHVQIGQGLNCWTSFALGKSLELTTTKKNAQVIRPHTSTEENRFLRGFASEVAFKKFSLLVFASNNQKDASLNSDSSNQISSVLTTGYHRTKSELARKDRLKENVLGAYLRYDLGTLHVGLASVFMHYSPSINSKVISYNQFDFRGVGYQSTSVDYSYTYRNLLVFGEFSYVDFSKKIAFLQGLMLALDSKNSVSLLYRNYDKGYETRYNAGFSEGNTVQNETGLYVAFTSLFAKYWSLQAYSDFFKFPWLKQQVSLPSKGLENCMQITWKPSKTLEFYVRCRSQIKEQNSSLITADLKFLTTVNQTNLRFNLMYKMTDLLEIRSRLEGVSISRMDKQKETGLLFFQDVNLTSKNKKSDLILRFVLFDTDSYASRIYSFESSPTYQYSSPAFYGKGIRAYLLYRLTFWKRLDCWIKVGNTIFQKVGQVSTSNEQFLSGDKRELNIQVRWKFSGKKC
jgi:hypothetical protein